MFCTIPHIVSVSWLIAVKHFPQAVNPHLSFSPHLRCCLLCSLTVLRTWHSQQGCDKQGSMLELQAMAAFWPHPDPWVRILTMS